MPLLLDLFHVYPVYSFHFGLLSMPPRGNLSHAVIANFAAAVFGRGRLWVYGRIEAPV